jgi:hypothetical protein
MTAALLEQIRGDGLTLRLSDDGMINYRGAEPVIAKWLPELRAHKAEIIEALKGEPRFTDWRLSFDQRELDIFVWPALTAAEVERQYPAAVRVEPIERPPSRPAATAERAELWMLINVVLADTPEEVGEAFAAALADVEAALVCYRSLGAAR